MSNSDKDRSQSTQPSGQFSFEGLDRVLHEKARLGILSSLVANPDGLLFSEFKELCSLHGHVWRDDGGLASKSPFVGNFQLGNQQKEDVDYEPTSGYHRANRFFV